MSGIEHGQPLGIASREGPVGIEAFSEAWMREYARLWNAEQAMVRELTRQRFNAAVGYGFLDQPAPRGLLVVARGVAEQAGDYDGRELDWDLRACPTDWREWLAQGFDLSRLLVAVGTQRLQVWKGDHKRILRKPPLVGALLRAFALMTEVRVAERKSS
jgi:hypothetical protein